MLVMVVWVVVAQAVCDVAGLQKEGTHVVRQDNRSGRGHRRRYRRHACCKDAGNQQASQTYWQTIDDEVGEHIVGLGLNVGRQWCYASLIIAVERRANKEKER